MMKFRSLVAGLVLAALSLVPVFAQGVGQLGSGQMFANTTAGVARAAPTGASAYFDFVYGSTRGAILYRGASGWTILAPGSSGLFLKSNGPGADPAYASVAGSGTLTSVVCNGVTITISGTCPPAFGFQNCSLAESHSSNNVTFAIKDNTGADPSATSPCNLWFRSATATAGSWVQVTLTAANSVTLNAGSTLGVTNTTATCSAGASCPFRVHAYAVYTGSTVQIAVTVLTNASAIRPFNAAGLHSTTACSACAIATAIGTAYSTAAQTNEPVVYLGYYEYASGLATAGNYASSPTLIQTMAHGVPLPGQTIQTAQGTNTTGNATSGTITFLNTNLAVTLSPTSQINIITVQACGTAGNTGNFFVVSQISRGGTAIGNPVGTSTAAAGFSTATCIGPYADTPGVTSATTYTVQIRSSNASGNANWDTGAPSIGSVIQAAEIQG